MQLLQSQKQTDSNILNSWNESTILSDKCMKWLNLIDKIYNHKLIYR